MRQHTPLPWKASVTKYFGKPDSEQEVVVHNGDVSICTLAASKGHIEEAMPDALFIARAVNCHDELVAALRLLPLDKPFEDASDYKDNAKHFAAAMDAARAAIANAEAKP